MYKRNQVVTVNYAGLGPRLAIVKSYRAADRSVNVTIALYKKSSIVTDLRVAEDQILSTVNITPVEFWSLARCLPQPDDQGCIVVKKQRQADAAHPKLAALRKCYGDYESGSQITARLKQAA